MPDAGSKSPLSFANTAKEGKGILKLFSGEAELFDVHEHVGGVGVNPKGAGALQFFLTIAAREETHAQRAFAHGGEQVPDAVADDDAVTDGDIQSICGEREYVGRRLGPLYVVSRDDGNLGGDFEML